jgi:DNA-binding CsgD family transcriptional regulator
MPDHGRSCSEARLFDLIDQIYEASLDPALWPRFLRTLSDTVGASASNFAFTDARSPEGRIGISVNLDPQATVEYGAYFGGIDPWVVAGREKGLFQAGCVLPAQAVVPHNDLLRTEFYDGFGRRYGMVRGMSGMISCDEHAVAAISLFVPERCEPYDEADISVIRRLLPHLRRALDIHQRLATVAIDAAALTFSLDQLVCGVIFVDSTGHVLSTNRAGHATLATNDGLVVRGGKLEAIAREDTVSIRRLIQGAGVAIPGGTVGAGGILRIRRRSARRPLVAVLAPLRPPPTLREMPDPPLQPGLVVFVHDPEREVEAPHDALARAFGLTRAEGRVAAALMTGDRLEDVAERLDVSINTVRTHLAHLFGKTGTRRQSELVRALTTFCPPVHLE